VIPKADQQVGGQAHQFPPHEQQQQAVGHHHAQHGRGKQGKETEEPGEIVVMGHVAHAIDKNQQDIFIRQKSLPAQSMSRADMEISAIISKCR